MHTRTWDFTHRRMVVPYRSFGTTCLSLFQGSSTPRRIILLRLLDPWRWDR